MHSAFGDLAGRNLSPAISDPLNGLWPRSKWAKLDVLYALKFRYVRQLETVYAIRVCRFSGWFDCSWTRHLPNLCRPDAKLLCNSSPITEYKNNGFLLDAT